MHIDTDTISFLKDPSLIVWMEWITWLFDKDIFIDIFSILVLFFILVYAINFYRLRKKETKYRYLITSFFLLMLSFIVKVCTNWIVYTSTTKIEHMGRIITVYKTASSANFLVFLGILNYRILALIAFYFLYLVYVDKPPRSSILFTAYLLLVVGYLSQLQYYVFHLTSFILLLMIVVHLLNTYYKKKNPFTKSLGASFFIIMVSQALFIFFAINPLFYVAAELIQLIGYLLLLVTFIWVIQRAKTRSH